MNRQKKYLIVIGGPTASGKTPFAIRLAQHFETEILSADSRQLYRQLDIGTAKPSLAERRLVKHHFIDCLDINTPYSVGDYTRDALALLNTLYEQYDRVVLTGGSGLYIKALCEGLDEFPEVPPAIRQSVEAQYRQEGLAGLQRDLEKADPDYYREVDTNNPHRLIRALAVYRASGRPFSSFRQRAATERAFTPIYLQLDRPRDQLYARIDQRVDGMMAAGLLEEARTLYPYREHTALQTVGYQELFDHFAGKYDLEEAVRLIKRNSRRYAKRQLTWLRRDEHWALFEPEEVDRAIEHVLK